MPENPIGTKEQREEYRILLADRLPHRETQIALDGLDIAEEMAEMLPAHAERGCAGCKIALARWQDWKQGMTPAEEEL